MKINMPEVKDKLIQRLKRIQGQLQGIERMLDDERDCSDIVQQLSAAQAALKGAIRIFLQEYASACLSTLDESAGTLSASELHARRQKIIEDMITLLNKAP